MLDPVTNPVHESSDGHEAGFVRFYDAEFQGQFRRAVLLLKVPSDAEEAVQQAFVAVWARWSSLEDPGPYLNRCVLNACRTQQRDRGRATRLADRLSRADQGSGGDHPNLMIDVLAELPFNQRAVIVLRYYGGLKDQEIAEALECPQGSVGPWMRRALTQLERRLQ